MLITQAQNWVSYSAGYGLLYPDMGGRKAEEFSLSNDFKSFSFAAGVADCADIIFALPVRYDGLPVRRKLIRMLLMLQRAEVRERFLSRKAFLPVPDEYTQWVIDTAMLRGELRYRSPEEMTRYYLLQVSELCARLSAGSWKKNEIRREIRLITMAFLEKYAVGMGLA